MSSNLTPLGELIQARQDVTGWSLRRLEKESGISKSMITKYKVGPLTDMPGTANLRALAAVLALPESVIVDAALATVGLQRPRGGGVPDLDEAIDSQPWLDTSDKEGLRAYLRSKRQGRRQA